MAIEHSAFEHRDSTEFQHVLNARVGDGWHVTASGHNGERHWAHFERDNTPAAIAAASRGLVNPPVESVVTQNRPYGPLETPTGTPAPPTPPPAGTPIGAPATTLPPDPTDRDGAMVTTKTVDGTPVVGPVSGSPAVAPTVAKPTGTPVVTSVGGESVEKAK